MAADPNAVASAREAGLRHTTDAGPGYRRRRAGRAFSYVDTAGRTIRDRAQIARIRRLAIPPAWTDVWICPSASGHLQATGRDARGRKQYRYHPRFRELRDETKFERLVELAEALPRVRARVDADLALRDLSREKVLATVVRLLETTFVRVGNEEYARENDSYGLTTLREEHVDVRGERVRFRFRGKGGKSHVVDVADHRVARVIRRCQDLPGQELFQYVDAGGVLRSIGSADVNEYLRSAAGTALTAKDFRTWAGTVLAYLRLRDAPAPASARRARRELTRAIAAVAARLGNTPAIARKCYVHPAILEAYQAGALRRLAKARPRTRPSGLSRDEAETLSVLRGARARRRAA